MTRQHQLSKQISDHDMSPFSFLKKIPGLPEYAGRATVCPGLTIVGCSTQAAHDNLLQNSADLGHICIGASSLLLIEGTNIGKALAAPESDHIRQRMRFFLENGWPLSFFLSRSMEPVVEALQISWDDVLTPHPEIAELFDDKHYVRLIAKKLGLHDTFPPWAYISSNIADLYRERAKILEEAPIPTNTVFLKVHNYDGGEGILRWTDETEPEVVRRFAKKYLSKGIVIDAGYTREEFGMREYSVKVLIHEDRWEVLYFTTQRIVSDGHVGNDVAIGEELVSEALRRDVVRKFSPIWDEAVARGYGKVRSRTMGVDFMGISVNNQEISLGLEVNARQTAADYAEAVCEQAAPRFGGQAAVVMENLSNLPKGIDYHQLSAEYLQIPRWDGADKPGFVLSNAGCLEHGKITVFVVAKTIAEARDLRERLLPNKTAQYAVVPQPQRRVTRAC